MVSWKNSRAAMTATTPKAKVEEKKKKKIQKKEKKKIQKKRKKGRTM